MARRTRRSCTAQFKAEVVLAARTGAQSQAELCRTHSLKPELVALGKKTFLERLPSVFGGAPGDDRAAARVAELERLVGRRTLEREVAKKASAWLPSVLRNGGRS
jgi:transposase-like protein